MTRFAELYHEKMFPGYTSQFLEAGPGFVERFDNLAFNEVINQGDLDGGQAAFQENSMYHAAKFGLEGFGEDACGLESSGSGF